MKRLAFGMGLLLLTFTQLCAFARELPGIDMAAPNLLLFLPPNVATNGAVTSFLDASRSTRLVFYVGTDQHVHDLEWNGTGPWQNFDLTTTTGAVPVATGGAMASFLDTIHPDRLVFYVGSDQHIHDLEWNGSWQTFDLTAISGGVAAATGGMLASFLDTIHPDRLVFYVGSDQHIHDLEWNGTGPWQSFDLTAISGGAVVANGGKMTGFLDTSHSSRLVFYTGSDQHVHDLEWNGADPWQSFDLTAISGGAVVATGGSLASFLDTTHPERMVFYVASDQHVHDLEWNGSWHTFDLTAISGGVGVASRGALTSFLDTTHPSRLAFYVGSDQHVHDLEWNGTGAWKSFDLSAISGGTSVAVGGAMTSFLDTSHPDRLVFYVASDQQVHDLEWNGTGPWQSFDISN